MISFLHNTLCRDGTCFKHESVFDVHNRDLWTPDNPPVILELGHHVRFTLSVWAGIVGNIAVGPYPLTAQRHHRFLETVLTGLLEVASRAAVR